MLQIGSVIDGTYKILNIIGQGGMSVVYLAMNERANKQWAIKEVRKDTREDYEIIKQRWIAETETMKKLHHENLPDIIDVIDYKDSFLIVMDYIEGNSLSTKLKEAGILEQKNVLEWAKQLCDVLGYLHSQKPPIIYRDMKPSNIILQPNGKVVLIDFGTAREYKKSRTEDTMCLGTRGYAAPEQYGGMGQTDARTDIYSLGATLYHLITGHNPSEPPYKIYPIRKWNPNLSPGLEAILWTCTRENPNDRYQSCKELAFDLEHYYEWDLEFRKSRKRKRNIFLTSVGVTLAAVCGCIGFRVAEQTTRRNNYEQYVIDAQSCLDQKEQIQLYEHAISLEPENEKGYLSLLEYAFMKDQEFQENEEKELRRLLGRNSGKKETNESYLRKNICGYEQFADRLAMLYYYYFEGGSNKAGAIKWLNIMAEASTLEQKKIERGKILSKIANYYSRIGVPDRAGDKEVTYLQYWTDLAAVTRGNLVVQDNIKTALRIYHEMIVQIHDHHMEFQQAGVTKKQMEDEIRNIEYRLKSDFDEIQRDDQESMKQLQENIAITRKELTASKSWEDRRNGGEDGNY